MLCPIPRPWGHGTLRYGHGAPCPDTIMKYDPKIHHRRSIRLPGYDYSSAGAYYVTICTREKSLLFGRVLDQQMHRNDLGDVAHEEWFRSAKLRDDIMLDTFVVMPNHIHGIIIRRGTAHCSTGTARRAPTIEQFGKPVAGSLPTLVRAYKSAVTQGINMLRKTPGAPVWQGNYYEHIVRSEVELNRIREYIATNPLRWGSDRYNPERSTSAYKDFDW